MKVPLNIDDLVEYLKDFNNESEVKFDIIERYFSNPDQKLTYKDQKIVVDLLFRRLLWFAENNIMKDNEIFIYTRFLDVKNPFYKRYPKSFCRLRTKYLKRFGDLKVLFNDTQGERKVFLLMMIAFCDRSFVSQNCSYFVQKEFLQSLPDYSDERYYSELAIILRYSLYSGCSSFLSSVSTRITKDNLKKYLCVFDVFTEEVQDLPNILEGYFENQGKDFIPEIFNISIEKHENWLPSPTFLFLCSRGLFDGSFYRRLNYPKDKDILKYMYANLNLEKNRELISTHLMQLTNIDQEFCKFCIDICFLVNRRSNSQIINSIYSALQPHSNEVIYDYVISMYLFISDSEVPRHVSSEIFMLNAIKTTNITSLGVDLSKYIIKMIENDDYNGLEMTINNGNMFLNDNIFNALVKKQTDPRLIYILSTSKCFLHNLLAYLRRVGISDHRMIENVKFMFNYLKGDDILEVQDFLWRYLYNNYRTDIKQLIIDFYANISAYTFENVVKHFIFSYSKYVFEKGSVNPCFDIIENFFDLINSQSDESYTGMFFELIDRFDITQQIKKNLPQNVKALYYTSHPPENFFTNKDDVEQFLGCMHLFDDNQKDKSFQVIIHKFLDIDSASLFEGSYEKVINITLSNIELIKGREHFKEFFHKIVDNMMEQKKTYLIQNLIDNPASLNFLDISEDFFIRAFSYTIYFDKKRFREVFDIKIDILNSVLEKGGACSVFYEVFCLYITERNKATVEILFKSLKCKDPGYWEVLSFYVSRSYLTEEETKLLKNIIIDECLNFGADSISNDFIFDIIYNLNDEEIYKVLCRRIIERARYKDSFDVNFALTCHERKNVFVGFINEGTQCFMNTAIQMLFRVTELVQKVFEYEGTDAFLVSLKRTFAFLALSDVKYISNKALMKSWFNENINLYSQQDVSEYIFAVFEILERELDKGVIDDLFSGEKVQILESIDKKNVQEVPEKFRDIFIFLKEPTNTLESCIANECETSNIGKIRFDGQEELEAVQIYKYTKLPKYLIVDICRFDKSGFKIMNQIELSSSFTLNDTEYSLLGIIIHRGDSLNYGHYFSCFHNTNNEWYLINDSNVKLIPFSKVNDQSDGTPYILLFIRSDIVVQELRIPKDLTEEVESYNKYTTYGKLLDVCQFQSFLDKDGENLTKNHIELILVCLEYDFEDMNRAHSRTLLNILQSHPEYEGRFHEIYLKRENDFQINNLVTVLMEKNEDFFVKYMTKKQGWVEQFLSYYRYRFSNHEKISEYIKKDDFLAKVFNEIIQNKVKIKIEYFGFFKDVNTTNNIVQYIIDSIDSIETNGQSLESLIAFANKVNRTELNSYIEKLKS